MKKDEPLISLKCSTEVTVVKFGYQEEDAISGCRAGSISIWDLHQQKKKLNLSGHMSDITCIGIDPYGDQYLVSGSYDTKVKIWDLRCGEAQATYKGHKSEINTISFTPDRKMVASGDESGYIRIYDLHAGKLATEILPSHGKPSSSINHLIFNPQQFAMAAACGDRTVK